MSRDILAMERALEKVYAAAGMAGIEPYSVLVERVAGLYADAKEMRTLRRRERALQQAEAARTGEAIPLPHRFRCTSCDAVFDRRRGHGCPMSGWVADVSASRTPSRAGPRRPARGRDRPPG